MKKEITCPRCKGEKYILGQEVKMEVYDGKLPNYKHNERGLCFLCDGAGKVMYDGRGKFVYKYKEGKELRYNLKGKYIGFVTVLPSFTLDEDTEYRPMNDEDLVVWQMATDFIEAEYKRSRLMYDENDPAFIW